MRHSRVAWLRDNRAPRCQTQEWFSSDDGTWSRRVSRRGFDQGRDRYSASDNLHHVRCICRLCELDGRSLPGARRPPTFDRRTHLDIGGATGVPNPRRRQSARGPGQALADTTRRSPSLASAISSTTIPSRKKYPLIVVADHSVICDLQAVSVKR